VGPIVPIVGALGFSAAVFFGWGAWVSHRTWSHLDSAARELHLPSGFTEIGRVRSGDGVCFVSCSHGGEAVLTVVMDPGARPADEACQRVEHAVRRLAGGAQAAADAPGYGLRCDISGSLSGTMYVRGGVAQHDDVDCQETSLSCARPRWTDTMPVPDLPTVAWIEFNGGIE